MLSNKIFALLLGLLAIAYAGCDKDDTDPNIPLLRLTPDNVTGEIWQGYRSDLVDYGHPVAQKDITYLYKQLNLKKDAEYGTVTVAACLILGNNHV